MASSSPASSKPTRPSGLRLLITGCDGCIHHHTLRPAGQCDPQDACVRAMSGRLIDRFFRRNPERAASYLGDPFWERRAIACRYAPLAALEPLLADRDEVVRRVVAYRAPAQWLVRLIQDPDRDVRIIVAEHLPAQGLAWAALDADYRVRLVAAQRLPAGKLMSLAADPDREVRKAVARRLPPFALERLLADPDPEVRWAACERLAPETAIPLLGDDDWRVRHAAVERVPVAYLADMAEGDPDPLVRETARRRLEGNPIGSA